MKTVEIKVIIQCRNDTDDQALLDIVLNRLRATLPQRTLLWGNCSNVPLYNVQLPDGSMMQRHELFDAGEGLYAWKDAVKLSRMKGGKIVLSSCDDITPQYEAAFAGVDKTGLMVRVKRLLKRPL